MKLENKKIFVLGALAVIAIFSLVGSKIVAAKDGGQEGQNQSMHNSQVGPVIINIDPNGNVLLRGKILSVGTDSLSVKSWGNPWAIKVNLDTKIASQTGKLADFKVGDFIGVQGSINEADFSITAKVLREWGPRPDHDNDGLSDNQDNDDDNDHIMDNQDQHQFDHNNDGQNDTEGENFQN